MKVEITIQTSKGNKTPKRDYQETVDELHQITQRIDFLLKDKFEILFTPLKDGVRMVAK